jgi:MFS family permease
MKRPRIFYGYWILATCSLFCVISMLASLSVFSLYVKPLQDALGWKRTEIMAGFTFMLVAIALVSPVTGRLLDSFGPKKVMIPGALMAVLGLVLLSRATSLRDFYIGYILIGTGTTTTGPVGAGWVVSHWFKKRRGMAVGIMAGGMASTGILIMPLMAAYLIPLFGWRVAYRVVAILAALIIFPLALFVLKAKPAEVGLFPDGLDEDDGQDTTGQKASGPPAISPRAALATSSFWFIALSLAFNHTHLGIFQSFVPYACDLGFPMGAIASILSAGGMAGCAGMLFFGWLCDRILPKLAAAIGLGLMAIGIILILCMNQSSSLAFLFVYAVLMGIGAGSWLPTMSMLTSSTFGMRSYGSIFGIMSFFQYAGGAVGPLIAGYSYDVAHSYTWGFLVIFFMVVSAILLVLSVPVKGISEGATVQEAA